VESRPRVPVLLDTDIGSDIDDALCLIYLLNHPACELVGVTTVRHDPVRRAKLVDALCAANGRTDMPIYAGHGAPLIIDDPGRGVPQAEVLKRWKHRNHFKAFEAVAFMREVIRSRPGEITLLAVGPLTNVALLFRMDPEIPALLKGFVSMIGGFSFSQGRFHYPSEANARLDPHAAAMVFRTQGLVVDVVSLDVTQQCRIPTDRLTQALASADMEIVKEMMQVWGRSREWVTFHDPLAAVSIFSDQLLEYDEGSVTVEISATHPKVVGLTVWDDESRGPFRHRRAVRVDVDRFFADYFSIVGALNPL